MEEGSYARTAALPTPNSLPPPPQHLCAELGQRRRPSAQRGPLIRVPAVEELRGGVHRLAERCVVRVPPEIARARGLPHHLLDVHALVEAELGVRAAEAGVLRSAPGALAGAVRVHVVVEPDHPGLEPTGHA